MTTPVQAGSSTLVTDVQGPEQTESTQAQADPASGGPSDAYQSGGGSGPRGVPKPGWGAMRGSLGRLTTFGSVGAVLLAATAFPVTEGGPLDVFPGMASKYCFASVHSEEQPRSAEAPKTLDVKNLPYDVGALAARLHQRHLDADPVSKDRGDRDNEYDAPPHDGMWGDGPAPPHSGQRIAASLRTLVAPVGFQELPAKMQTALLNVVGRETTAAHDMARDDLLRALASRHFTSATPARQADIFKQWVRHQPQVSPGYNWSDSARNNKEVRFKVKAATQPSDKDLKLLKKHVRNYVDWQRHDVQVHGHTVSLFLSKDGEGQYTPQEFGRALARLPAFTARHMTRVILAPPDVRLHPTEEEERADPEIATDFSYPEIVKWKPKPRGPRPELDGAVNLSWCVTLRAPPQAPGDEDFAAYANPDGVTLFKAPQRWDDEGRGPTGSKKTGDGSLETLIAHEAGHHIAGRLWGWGGTEEGWKNYVKAATLDGTSVTDYSFTHPHEDFSEHHALYVEVVGTPKEADARALYGARFKAIDALYAQAAHHAGP